MATRRVLGQEPEQVPELLPDDLVAGEGHLLPLLTSGGELDVQGGQAGFFGLALGGECLGPADLGDALGQVADAAICITDLALGAGNFSIRVLRAELGPALAHRLRELVQALGGGGTNRWMAPRSPATSFFSEMVSLFAQITSPRDLSALQPSWA